MVFRQIHHWKTASLFVSSTFRDMQLERDHLVQDVIPRLRQELRKYRLHLAVIDLRWGVNTFEIPDASRKRLEVVEVCLREVDRAGPYVIALLGDSYGWIPDLCDLQAGFNVPDLARARGKSLVELEMEFGIFSRKETWRGYCYLRKQSTSNGLPISIAETFCIDAEPPEAREAQTRLQRRVKDELPGDRVRTYEICWNRKTGEWDGLHAWGEQIYNDLLKTFATDFGGQGEDSLTIKEARRLELEFFLSTHLKQWQGPESLVNELVEHLTVREANGPLILAVSGAPGSGKSALFATLVHKLQGVRGTALIHSVGIGSGTETIGNILEAWVAELAEKIGREVPDLSMQPLIRLQEIFAQYASQAVQAEPLYLMLDGADRLESDSQGKSLRWLVECLPPSTKLLVTAAASMQLTTLTTLETSRSWSVPDMTAVQASALVRKICEQNGRTLSEALTALLLDKRNTDGGKCYVNPLWVTLAVEQLNCMTSQDYQREASEFDQKTTEEHLLEILTTFVSEIPGELPALYQWIFQRIQNSFDPVAVEAIMSLIAADQEGLRETDLEFLVPRLTQQVWSPFALAGLRWRLGSQLTKSDTSEQWRFSHYQGWVAAREMYLADAGHRQRLHQLLAEHWGQPNQEPAIQVAAMRHCMLGNLVERAVMILGEWQHGEAEVGPVLGLMADALCHSEREVREKTCQWIGALLNYPQPAPWQLTLLERVLWGVEARLVGQCPLADRTKVLNMIISQVKKHLPPELSETTGNRKEDGHRGSNWWNLWATVREKFQKASTRAAVPEVANAQTHEFPKSLTMSKEEIRREARLRILLVAALERLAQVKLDQGFSDQALETLKPATEQCLAMLELNSANLDYYFVSNRSQVCEAEILAFRGDINRAWEIFNEVIAPITKQMELPLFLEAKTSRLICYVRVAIGQARILLSHRHFERTKRDLSDLVTLLGDILNWHDSGEATGHLNPSDRHEMVSLLWTSRLLQVEAAMESYQLDDALRGIQEIWPSIEEWAILHPFDMGAYANRGHLLILIGRVHRLRGMLMDSMVSLQQAGSLLDQLPHVDPEHAKWIFVWGAQRLEMAQLLMDCGNEAGAVDLLTEAHANLAPVVSRDPGLGNMVQLMAQICELLGAALRSQLRKQLEQGGRALIDYDGYLRRSIHLHRDALNLWSSLRSRYPDSKYWAVNLARSKTLYADACLESGGREFDVKIAYEEALAIARETLENPGLAAIIAPMGLALCYAKRGSWRMWHLSAERGSGDDEFNESRQEMGAARSILDQNGREKDVPDDASWRSLRSELYYRNCDLMRHLIEADSQMGIILGMESLAASIDLDTQETCGDWASGKERLVLGAPALALRHQTDAYQAKLRISCILASRAGGNG